MNATQIINLNLKTTRVVIFTLMAMIISSSVANIGAVEFPKSSSNLSLDAAITPSDNDNGIPTNGNSTLTSNATYPTDLNLGTVLSDNDNSYGKEWDPWISKAAIHAIATSADIPFMQDGDMLALAGGYLYDNEVHLYRWNYDTTTYDKVWEIGDSVFTSDVFSLAFADTDYNNLTEVICGCEDGRFYVFEQRHIYDPITNMENQFDLVYTSPRLGRVFAIMVSDTDKDYRKDIIVGTGNTIRFYEYDHHSGYPFNVPHWINYEQVFEYTLDSQITALAVGDVNYNGLPDVEIGTHSGEIVVLENDGTVLYVNGDPWPICQDNAYVPIWSSGQAIRRPVSSMSTGNLDTDNGLETIVAVQGQGAYILDMFGSTIGAYRVERTYDNWEADPAGAYPLDNYLDNMVNSSARLSSGLGTYNNVYMLLGNGSKGYEPLTEGLISLMPNIYPYNSAMLQQSSGNYTFFNGTVNNAWAIVDFGNDEEAAGNGITSSYDLYVKMVTVDHSPLVNISISQDGIIWSNPIKKISTNYYDVDTALIAMQWDYYRYLKVNVTGGTIKIDYIKTESINKPLYDALSTAVGTTMFAGDYTPTTVGFVGTIDGCILMITKEGNKYQVVWDSWRDERWKLEKNIFSLAIAKKTGRFPAWIYHNSDSYLANFQSSGALPDGGNMTSFTAENFYNWRWDNNLDFIVSSSKGNLLYYKQSSEFAPIQYDSALTTEIFQYVQTRLNTLNADYYTAAVFPMFERVGEEYGEYWLFVGTWNGTLGQMEFSNKTYPPVGSVDFHLFHLYSWFDSGSMHYSFFNVFPDTESDPLTLSTTEKTGQLWGIMRESVWMPKVAAAEMLGSNKNDLIVTNGKVHLIETLSEVEPIAYFWGASVGNIETAVVDNYFKEINEDSKGRIWTNANPVNFDGDDDIDLILGFARYDEVNFGFRKMSYGFTYWENEGTKYQPKWVEEKKAVTNNVPETNFRVNLYTDPILVYDDYDFGEYEIPPNGYHPSFRTELPTRLLMFQNVENNSYLGNLVYFTAQYSHPTSLLAATYPEAKRIDINLIDKPTPAATNYGFHIFETWNNEDELRGWTLAMATSDLDEDGKNEVIVGDFNNNMYVFEHLTNNTYKRAFRSFDINRTILTTDSPYAYEQFPGISGTFYRTVFEHIKYVLANNIDLDKDGLQEFIGATDTQIFIFEATYTTAEYIRDDTYKLVKIIDLNGIPALTYLAEEDFLITAITTGDDLTADGRQELLIALGPALIILEINADFTYSEVFFGNSYSDWGIYDFPGNYLIYPTNYITAILVNDLDCDGYKELVIMGMNRTIIKSLWKNFGLILEWQDDRLYHVARIENTNYGGTTPVDLEVDDADYDGHKELLLAHEKGVDIYEFTGNNQYALREIITSNPNYPLLTTCYWEPYNALGDLKTEKDALRLANGTILLVFVQGDDVHMARSQNNGTNWLDNEVILDHTIFEAVGLKVAWSRHPGIGQAVNGDIWVAFEIRRGYTGAEATYWRTELYALVYDVDVGSWVNIIGVALIDYSLESDSQISLTPSLYTLYGDSDDSIGIAFNFPDAVSPAVKFGNIDGPSGSFAQDAVYSWANGTKFADQFSVTAIDVVRVEKTGGDYGLVFSGYLYQEEVSMDYDLFYSPFNITRTNTTHWDYTFTRPNRIIATGMSSFHPSIIREEDTGNLIIAYEEQTLKPYGGLWAIWSNNDGLSWNGPYDMTNPLGFDNFGLVMSSNNGLFNDDGYVVYDKVTPISTGSGNSFYLQFHHMSSKGWSINPITSYDVEYPILIPGAFRGFSFIYSISFKIHQGPYEYKWIASANNLWSNCTWYEVNNIHDIALGDSDRDGRHEILIASDKQAVLVEYQSNGVDWILHQQKWKSPVYDRPLTAVAISDANGNGLPELLIESDRGIVNSYEVNDKSMGQADILYPKTNKTLSYAGTSAMNFVTEILTLDLDNNGYEDFIYGTSTGKIVAVNGNTLTPFFITGQNSTTSSNLTSISILYNTFTHVPMLIVLNHLYTVSTYDITNGALYSSTTFSTLVTACHVANLQPTILDGQIIIGFVNATIAVYNQKLNTILWRNNYALSTLHPITAIKSGYLTNQSQLDIVALARNGSLVAFHGNNGTIHWKVKASGYALFYIGYGFKYHTNYFLGLTDLNKDNFTDVVAGISRVYAFDGYTGNQLWNVTNAYPNANPVLADINNDAIDDILVGRVGANSYNGGAIALSGSSGATLWECYADSRYNRAGAQGVIDYGVERTVYAGVSKNNFAYLLDLKSGVVLTRFPLVSNGTAIAISNLCFDRPVVLVGDQNGTITIFSLYNGITPVATPTPVEKITSITSRGSFTSHLAALSTTHHVANLNADSYDDLFEVNNNYIEARSGSDGAKLWTYSVIGAGYGAYQGIAKIADIDNDNSLELVAVFQYGILAFTMGTSSATFQWFFWFSASHTEQWNDGKLVIDNIDTSGIGVMEVVYTHICNNGSSTIGIFDGRFGITEWYLTFASYNPTALNVGRFRNQAASKELALYFTIKNQAYEGILAIFDHDGALITSLSVSNPASYFPPVTDIAVGEFSSTYPGQELVLFGDYCAVDWRYTDAFDFLGTYYSCWGLDASYTLKGVAARASGIPSYIKQHWVIDMDNNGISDLVTITVAGDIYIINGTTFQNSAKALNCAVQYSPNTAVPGKLISGKYGLVTASYHTLTVYNTLTFKNIPVPSFIFTRTSMVFTDLLIGNFDGQGNFDDIAIVDQYGAIWIVDSSNFGPVSKLSTTTPTTPDGIDLVTTLIQRFTPIISGMLLIGTIALTFNYCKLHVRKRKVD